MANRYILNPDGSIQKLNNNGVLENKEYLTHDDAPTSPAAPLVFSGTSPAESRVDDNDTFISKPNASDVDYDFLENFIGIIPDANKSAVTYTITDDKPSFGFESGKESVEHSAYKPMYRYDNNTTFADEFEILSGSRLRSDEIEADDIVLLLFTYFTASIVRLLIVEVIVLANNAFNSASGYGNVSERVQLRFGKYDLTEYDIFTKYVFNVLNYPHEKSSIIERILSFFVGFNEYLAPDALIDFDEIIKESTSHKHNSSENVLDGAANLFSDVNKSTNILIYALSPIATAALETVVAALTNQAVNKRARLLLKKFKQEAYWRNVLLYKAKDNEPFIDFFTDLNYYYFKFYIERIHVGLKIFKKYVFEDSYMKRNQFDAPQNRVSAKRSNHINHSNIVFPNPKPEDPNKTLINYEWDSSKTGNSGPLTKGKFIKKAPQTTRLRALPQLFTLHKSLYRAIALNNTVKNESTFEMGEDLKQNFYKNEEKRIPEALVEEIENVLEAEYMPFYFHDLRTNEILSFHAFIDSITDSFNPEYNSASGFGRIDDVRSYIKTTRNLNLSFTIAATSTNDHDLMWYQINKLVAMVYPQWSDAYAKDTKDETARPTDFKYPFTQVPTASPLIRLRVGDVIKSNYSRLNLSRLHGFGNRKYDESWNSNNFESYEKDKTTKMTLLPGLYKAAIDDLGFGAPKSSWMEKSPKSIRLDHEVEITHINGDDDISIALTRDSANLSMPGITTPDDNFVNVTIVNPFFAKGDDDDFTFKIPPEVLVAKELILQVDASMIRETQVSHNLIDGADKAASFKEIIKPFKDGDKDQSNNPITKSYESGMSRGLAGFITQLDVNYNEVNWDTGRIGSKAPMLVKVTVNFAPIHDIPPGLDHNGMMRAPVYNVGRINNSFFGDSQDKQYVGEGRAKALEKYNKILRSESNTSQKSEE